MASKNEITKVTPSEGALALPEYMREAGTAGVDALKEYVSPPRIKVVQKQANADLLAIFNVGDVIIVPQQLPIVQQTLDERTHRPTGEVPPFLFTPLYFFTEWCTWNHISTRGQLPAVRERSIDPNSEIAIRSRNADTRVGEQEGVEVRYVEHLNFIVMLSPPHQLAGEAMTLSFAKAEHAAGRKLASLIRMRKAAIYGGVYQANVTLRKNQAGDWWGIEPSNPSIEDARPWVSEELFKAYGELHREFADLHARAQLRPEYEDGDSSDPASTPAQTEY